MDVSSAAKQMAARLLDGAPSTGKRERAARLLGIAGDRKGAAAVWKQAGHDLEARARGALARGEPSEAVQGFLDAAESLGEAGEAGAAKHAAAQGLAHWESLAAAKRIVVRPRAPKADAKETAPHVRRLPRSKAVGAGAAPAGGTPAEGTPAEGTPAEGELPTMFVEMRGRLLRLAGREQEAEAAYESLVESIAAEVARRRKEQQWQEALEGARSWLKAAAGAGGRARLDQVRSEFVRLAREAAAEAATPEYFARGHDEVPARAMADALLEAHALGDEALASKYEEENQLVLERTAEVLEALRNRRTAAEALLAWEHHWAMISARGEAKSRLLALSETGRDFAGALGLAGVARTHPLRAEVDDFAQRLNELVDHATAQAPAAYARAAEACLPGDAQRAQRLAARGLALEVRAGAQLGTDLARLARAALVKLGRAQEAGDFHRKVLGAIGSSPDDGEGQLLSALEEARFGAEREAGGDASAREQEARRALRGARMARGVARFEAGDLEAARKAFHGASVLGEPEADRWIELLDLSPGP